MIVHSPYVMRCVRATVAARLPVVHVPHGVTIDPLATKARARAELNFEAYGLPRSTFLVTSFGHLQAHKRLTQSLTAFARLAAHEPDAHYVLIGPRCPEYDLDAVIDGLALRTRVRVLDSFLDEVEVTRWLRAADLGFNLRGPSYGGTSGTLVKMMAQELPVIVSPAPELSHFSPDAVCFVACDGREVENLYEAMLSLRRDEPGRLALGARARSWLQSAGFGWDRVASRYAEIAQPGAFARSP